ncbi:protein-L-isoaspartate O-methyltransferase family protein [Aestuariibius sp. 2305UL40-4]|uniref:protein-L-isoaspartate O-methyltransferase family protein n=1 Tax=Aestuariibius violaceus TaxID=3234132 RepID=UPI00345E5684
MADYAERRRIMVDTQIRPSDVTKFPIIKAMLNVPREAFVPDAAREAAYMGEHLPLAPGRVILDPRVVAKMINALDADQGDVALDIGCGLGYSAALLAQLCEAVVAVEDDAARVADAQAALSEHDIDNAAVIEGALADGAPKHGPYDIILIEGGVETVPDALTDQLKDGGRIAALFVDGRLGTVRIGHRTGGRLSWRDEFNAGAPVLDGFRKEAAFQF